MSEDFKIFLEDFIDLLNAQESSIVKMRMQIEKLVGASPRKEQVARATSASPKLPFDVGKIKWQDRENEKGKFQVSEDYSNPEHKQLLRFLNEHVPSKCITSGEYFYWVYPSGAKIGRKVRKAKGEAKGNG
jgi:hypothetical protein